MAKSKVRAGDTLLPLRNLIRGAQTTEVISRVRSAARTADYAALIKWLKTTPLYVKKIARSEYPRDYPELKRWTIQTSLTTGHELLWAAETLAHHGDAIHDFLSISNQFQKAFLLGDHQEAEKSLTLVRQKYGVSLWLLKNQIAFLQDKAGFDAQKALANDIKELQPRKSVTAYITHFVSFRNEDTVSATRFAAIFEKNLAWQRISTPLRSYLKFHILNRVDTPSAIAGILSCECSSPIVDYYETVLQLATLLDGDMPEATTALRMLFHLTKDPRAARLLFSVSGDRSALPDVKSVDTTPRNLFLQGSYAAAAEAALQAIKSDPTHIPHFEIMAVASLLSEQNGMELPNSLAKNISILLRDVLVKTEETSQSLMSLMKVALNFSGQQWAEAIGARVLSETSAIPIADLPANSEIFVSGDSKLCSSEIWSFSDPTKRTAFAAELSDRYGAELSTTYAIAVADSGTAPPGLTSEEAIIFDVRRFLLSSNYFAALSEVERLFNSEHSYYCQMAMRIKAFCLHKNGELKRCIQYITSVYLELPYMHLALPIAEVLEEVTGDVRDALKGEISLSILYDMHSKHIGVEFDSERSYAFEDFLIDNCVRRPSALGDKIEAIGRDKLVYYWREICVPQIMDCSIFFDSSKDLEEERIAVCRLLADIDVQNVEAYQAEVKEITKRHVIQRGLRQVEQSRVYVDTTGILKVADKTMRESFNRYISFRRSSLGIGRDEEVMDAVEKAVEGDARSLHQLEVPKNEMMAILESLLVGIRDEFVSSTEHGLDGYLSVRIRHGTLSGALRSPLEVAKLISQRDRSGTYKGNSYWRSRLAIKGPVIDEIVSRLALFSREFDDVVSEITSKWLQVRKDLTGAGLFDFSITRAWLRVVANFISPETTFEEFMELVLRVLNQRLEINLDHIRHMLSTTAKKRFSDLLLKLQSDLEIVTKLYVITELDNALKHAHTETLNAVDRVTGWFKLSTGVINPDFSPQYAIDISLQAVKNYYQNVNIHLDTEGAMTIELRGHYLTAFVDIFFIIFENIVRHSDMLGGPKIVIRMVEYGTAFRIRIENEVGTESSNATAKERVDTIKEAVRQGQYKTSVSREGGTGFHKIRKILEHDIGAKFTLDFGFEGESTFFVDLLLHVKPQEKAA